MINEERVILMTKMASYEQKEGKRNVAIGNYFRGDYIGYQVLKAIISATLAFMIVLGMGIFSNFETLLQEIYEMDLLALGKKLLYAYLTLIVLYGAVAYLVYAYRYRRARRSLKAYYGNLKKLSKAYEER